MAESSETLALPTPTPESVSRSHSPIMNRQPSRSPQPYSRQRPGFSRSNSGAFTLALTPSPESSTVALSRGTGYGGSESGTEADDELTRRLPAPPGRRHMSSDDEGIWDNADNEGRGRRRGRRGWSAPKIPGKPRRLGIAVLRRGIEVGLAAVLAVVVLFGKEQRALKEILHGWKDVFYWWLVPYLGVHLVYLVRALLRSRGLQLPKSLDPSPLIYPTLYPVIIACSLTPVSSGNRYFLPNLVVSMANLPPVLTFSPEAHWLLSILPMVPCRLDLLKTEPFEQLSSVWPLATTLTAALADLLKPSLTTSELRLLSAALINLLLHARSPQAQILKALLWGGGVAVFLLCEDVIKWNVSLARVPVGRFRRAGNTIISLGRLRKLATLKTAGWTSRKQASDSEAEVASPHKHPRRRSKISFFATLTGRQARIRRIGYAAWVYGVILGIVLIGLRPYIAHVLLMDPSFDTEGIDPFIWGPSYIFCGQTWYQNVQDWISPGSGYCVTEGSTAAASLRLRIIGLWTVVLVAGLTIVATFSQRLEVDTRRKVFHGMVIPMFLVPGLFDPLFTHLCLSIALALFLLSDVVRAGQLPPASRYIARFLQPYVDGRDLKGPVVVSHVFLLVGAGIGWWLTLASYQQKGWDWKSRVQLAFSSGVACVGLGDAAASLVGRRLGKHKWGWKGGKSIEGSLAFTVAVVSGLSVARLSIVGLHGDWGPALWGKLMFTGVWGSMLEAVATGVNDNVVVPVGVWAVVRGLEL